MPSEYDSIALRLSAQRALLGNVPPNLRSFSAEIRDETLAVQAVFDQEPSHQDKDLLSTISTEMIADCPSHFGLEEYFLVVPEPEKITNLKHCLFERYEK